MATLASNACTENHQPPPPLSKDQEARDIFGPRASHWQLLQNVSRPEVELVPVDSNTLPNGVRQRSLESVLYFWSPHTWGVRGGGWARKSGPGFRTTLLPLSFRSGPKSQGSHTCSCVLQHQTLDWGQHVSNGRREPETLHLHWGLEHRSFSMLPASCTAHILAQHCYELFLAFRFPLSRTCSTTQSTVDPGFSASRTGWLLPEGCTPPGCPHRGPLL